MLIRKEGNYKIHLETTGGCSKELGGFDLEIRLVGRFENPFKYILKEEVERAHIFKDSVWVRVVVGEEL